jgi:Flp pilus assembly protein TadG
MLMLLPFFALILLVVDTAYGLFIRATLQYAVEAGANYAASDTANGLLSGINQTVKAQSMNLLQPANVTVSFYATDGTVSTNLTGNLVQVSASYSFAPLAPLFRSAASIPLSATAAAVLTASPPPSL